MSDEDVNHRVKRRDLDISLITGGEVTALCGEVFTPGLRVGGGGKADEPGWPDCLACERIMHHKEQIWALEEQVKRLKGGLEWAELVNEIRGFSVHEVML